MKENKNNIFIRVLMIGLVGFIIWIITYIWRKYNSQSAEQWSHEEISIFLYSQMN